MRLAMLVVVTVLALSGCAPPGYSVDSGGMLVRCVDGVEYLVGGTGPHESLTPHYKPDGSLFTCNSSKPAPQRRTTPN
jgi:hypothetical protein